MLFCSTLPYRLDVFSNSSTYLRSNRKVLKQACKLILDPFDGKKIEI